MVSRLKVRGKVPLEPHTAHASSSAASSSSVVPNVRETARSTKRKRASDEEDIAEVGTTPARTVVVKNEDRTRPRAKRLATLNQSHDTSFQYWASEELSTHFLYLIPLWMKEGGGVWR